eukprot:scaffold273945_cov42-Prasinocladus_malaysianus.AAC.2
MAAMAAAESVLATLQSPWERQQLVALLAAVDLSVWGWPEPSADAAEAADGAGELSTYHSPVQSSHAARTFISDGCTEPCYM